MVTDRHTTPATLEATPPVLALFRAGPLAILRIHDLDFSAVVSSVVHSLPAGVTSLMLVTPTDTKMFNLSNGKARYANPHTDSRRRDNVSFVGESEESLGEGIPSNDVEDTDPQEEAIHLAVEDEGAAQASSIIDTQAEADTADTPVARRRALKKLNEATPAVDPCRRCQGTGQIAVALESGGAAAVACGVCQGKGVIRRFGEHRR